MKPLSIQQIRQAVGGRLLSPVADAGLSSVAAVCTDSRRMEPACVFVAIRGETFDGHDFLPAAAAHGAVVAIMEDVPAIPLPNLAQIQVPNTRKALGRLAGTVRRELTRTKVIGVAGSNGKTGTKLLIDAALCGARKGSISPKSYNNDIGVPLAIFPADASQDYLVLEMGTNRPGEIAALTDIAQPDIAVITNCSAEHLEGLGDLAGVRRENASLLAGLRPGGVLIVNGDDRQLLDAVARYEPQMITFGFSPTNDLFATDVRTSEEGTRFFLNGSRTEVFIPLLGRHTAANALAALAVARRMRVPEEIILDGLAHARGPDMRLQLQDCAGVELLNDAYNANPASMLAALDTLRSLHPPGRRIAVLGDMLELGEASDAYHRQIGRVAATCGIDRLACVGPAARLIAEAAIEAGLPPGDVYRYNEVSSAASVVPGWLKTGDLVLLKASRGIYLELIAQAVSASRRSLMVKAAG